jgi:hypothetical protein
MARTDEQLTHDFTYHAPDEATRGWHEDVRYRFRGLALDVNQLPESREKALALTKLEEASFWVHAALARNGAPER